MVITDYKKEIRDNGQINFIRKNRKIGEKTKLPGIIIIQETGDRFSVRTNKSNWKRFDTQEDAIKYAESLMGEYKNDIRARL